MATEPKKTKQQAYNESLADSIKYLITNSDQSWRKEWASDGYRQQGYKGNEYKNTNQLILFKKAVQENYTDPRWMTFNQIVENGYKLEKGTKASTVMFYTNTRKELVRDENGKPKLDSNGEKTYKNHLLDRPVAVSYNVFNATKIDGIEPFSLNQSQNQNTQPLMSAADIIKLDEGTRNRNDSVDLNNLTPAESRSLRNELENDIKQVEEERKISQLEIIKQYNPMSDEIHTGIRDIADIKSFEETGGDNFLGAPDYSEADYNQALENRNITVYSSKPIEQGVLVTPSRMEAENYAGNGEIYSKNIPVSAVAWIDSIKGQFADVHHLRAGRAEIVENNPNIDLLHEKYNLPPNWNGSHYVIDSFDGKKEIHIGLTIEPNAVRELNADSSTHRPENNGINPSNMTDVFAEDFYRNPEYYEDMSDKSSKQSFGVLRTIRDNPDAEVTIYRADNANYLVNADWVSLSKNYAEEHADLMRETMPDVRVTSYQAKVSDLNINGDSINELGLFADDARLKEINSTANEIQEPRAIYYHPDAEIYNDINGHFIEARKIYDNLDWNNINRNIDIDADRLNQLTPDHLHANNELGALIEAYQPLTGEYLERERPLSAYVETKDGVTIEAEPAMFEVIKAIPDNWGGDVAQMGGRTLINVIDEDGKMDVTEFKPDLNDINYDRLNELLNELDADEVKDLKAKISEKEELAQEQRKPEEYQPVGLDLVDQRLLHNLYQWLKSDDGYEIQRQTGETPETVGTVATEAEAIDITDWLNNFNGLPQPEKNEAITQLEQLREQSLALGFNGGDNGLNTGDNPNAPQLPDYAKIDQDIAAYVENNGLRLQEMSSEGAFFQNGTDSKIVVVPLKEQFGENQDAYYATLFHELTHSTKVLENSRQGFETDTPRGNNFGSQNYAREELVAEVGALLLCQHYGINSFIEPDNEKVSDLTQNSAAYLKNWIENGKLEDTDIVKAVNEAKRSTNAITGQTQAIANKIEKAEKLEIKQNEGMKV